MASPTTAIIRIKRRIEENPLDTLILNCKRFKCDNILQHTSTSTDDANSTKTDSTLFKFVGTLDKEESPLKYLKEKTIINLKYQRNKEEKLNKIIDKIKHEQKDLSKQNRLKIINCHRALNDYNDIDNELIKTLNESVPSLSAVIVDVESELSTLKQEQNNNEYVYDIYYTTNNQQFNDNNFSFDLLHSIEPLDDLIFNDDKYRNHEDDDDELIMSDDTDSNDENNWRNDYPDDEEFDNMNGDNQNNSDDDVEFLNNIMKTKFNISNNRNDDVHELSSTDDDDEYYDHDVALKYGKRYAQFKAREKDCDYDISDNTGDDDDIFGSDRDQYYYNDEDDDNDE